MAKYTVWVSGEGDGGRVNMIETERAEEAAAYHGSLMKGSGSSNFTLGITVEKPQEGGQGTMPGAGQQQGAQQGQAAGTEQPPPRTSQQPQKR